MRRFARLLVPLAAIVGTPALARGDAPDVAALLSKETLARVERYLEDAAGFGFSGVVLVAKEGKTAFERGYGFADRGTGRRNDADTLFEIASATKPFTACAILRLEEMGKLALDDPIGKHLPGVPQDKSGITIRHLLSHTSGMPRSAAGGGGPDLETAVRGYLATAAARPPGKAFEYWNGGYALLAGIVERASGRPYVDFCREQLFQRAGLERTGFTGDAGLPAESQAVGYDGEQRVRLAAEHPYRDYGWQYRGMGGIVTSARELARFVAALEAGRVVALETLRRMETPVTANQGLGWGIATTARKTRRVGHGGDVRGFHAEIERFPDERTTVIVLSNVERVPLWTIAWNLEALLFGGTPPYPVPPATVSLDDDARKRLEGTYRLKEGEALVIEVDGASLRVGAEGPEASRRLSGGPAADLAAETAEALVIVEAVCRKDAASIASRLKEGIPKTWPKWLVESIWPAHLEKWGDLRSVRALGAVAQGPRAAEVIIGLTHAKGEARLRIVLAGGKLSIFDLKGPRFAVSLPYRPVSATEFASFAWLGSQPPRIRFEGEPAARALVLQAGEAGEIRLRRDE